MILKSSKMSSKDSSCLVCSSGCVQDAYYFEIFEKDPPTEADLHIATVISKLLNKEIEPDPVNVQLICQKCFNLIEELKELQTRAKEIRNAIFGDSSYQSDIKDEIEDNDHSSLPMEMAFAPYSDEDVESCFESVKLEETPTSEGDDNTNPFTSETTSENSSGKAKKPLILKKRVSEPRKNVESVASVPIFGKKNNFYTCLICEEYRTEGYKPEAIRQHLRNIHDLQVYICSLCERYFSDKNSLHSHLDEHMAAQSEGDFQCEFCNKIFNTRESFRLHGMLCGKHQHRHVCQTCGEAFAKMNSLKTHEKIHDPRPYSCSSCDKAFFTFPELADHEQTHLEAGYSCEVHGKCFESSNNVQAHQTSLSSSKPFICRMCGKGFARKADIKDHERTHTGERPYQCEICGARFTQRSNLQSHKRATHYDDKRYQCSDCGRRFKRRRLLQYHIKSVHTGERPYKCNICQATFVCPEHFKKHLRIHTGEKPFPCEVCGRAFNSRDNRRAHRYIHSNKKAYECLVCGLSYMRKPLLYQHMQSKGHLYDTIIVNEPKLAKIVEELETSSEGKIQDQDGNQNIIIDGQQITFEMENCEESFELEQVVGGRSDDEFEEIITSEALPDGETHIIETTEGQVQLVKIQIPNKNGEDEEAWIKIVPE